MLEAESLSQYQNFKIIAKIMDLRVEFILIKIFQMEHLKKNLNSSKIRKLG